MSKELINAFKCLFCAVISQVMAKYSYIKLGSCLKQFQLQIYSPARLTITIQSQQILTEKFHKSIIMSRCNNIVITGANRGIGLELVKQMLVRFKPDNLFATYRNAEASKDLLQLAKENKNLHVFALDVRATEKYPEFAAEVDKVTKGAGVNLLINNAGIALRENNVKLSELLKEDLLYQFEVNTVGPMLLCKAFLPLLEKGAANNASAPLGISRAVILNVSSSVASISENGSGGGYGYRASKTALNQATKNMSIELLGKGVIAAPLHPGWVKTDLGGANALLESSESVSGILNVLESLDESKNGHFMRFDGKECAW